MIIHVGIAIASIISMVMFFVIILDNTEENVLHIVQFIVVALIPNNIDKNNKSVLKYFINNKAFKCLSRLL